MFSTTFRHCAVIGYSVIHLLSVDGDGVPDEKMSLCLELLLTSG